MNRAARRAQARVNCRATKPQPDAYNYCVPADRVALILAVEDHAPIVVQTRVDTFSDMLADIERFVAGWGYQRVLNSLAATWLACVDGKEEAHDALLVAYWLAFHHPTGGHDIRRLVAGRMARA